MTIVISDKPFKPWEELHRHEELHADLLGRFGATAVFVGSMRDFNAASIACLKLNTFGLVSSAPVFGLRRFLL